MDDIPWHYVAMIFIVFVSWLYQRVQEISAARRLRGAQKKAAAEAARKERPVFQETRTLGSPPPMPRPAQAPTASPAPVPAEIPIPKSFRELFETIETLSNPQAPPPVQRSSPPPPPLPVPAVVETHPAPVAKPKPEPKEPTSSPVPGLARVLRHRKSLREALILKEVLDAPVSMR